MLPPTLGVFVHSLFMRVGWYVCVTLPSIIIYHDLPLYNQQSAPYLILLWLCIWWAPFAIPWENINNDTLNISEWNATTVYLYACISFCKIKTYRTTFHGVIAMNLTRSWWLRFGTATSISGVIAGNYTLLVATLRNANKHFWRYWRGWHWCKGFTNA